MPNKSLQQRLEEARATSPLNDLTHQQAAIRASNAARKGTPGVEPWNKNKTVGYTWNKGIEGKESWGKTRKERGKLMTQDERKAYFGTVNHSDKTKKQMTESAKNRWAKSMKRVYADGVEYDNHYQASEALDVHKDTILWRCKNKAEKWQNWYYIDDK